MDNYSFPPSYAESAGSSPRSLPWEERQPAANTNYKVKFMCSYGGKVLPRPNDNQLSYIGGETKILSVDRRVKLADLLANLSSICNSDVSFKYQMPGEDLDALISVTNEDDLELMINEFDRNHRGSLKPARMRLFLFPVARPAVGVTESVGFTEGRGGRERFVEALMPGSVQAAPPPPVVDPASNIDLLFGFDKAISPPPVSVGMKFHDSGSDPGIPPLFTENPLDQMQRMQIGGQRRGGGDLIGGFSGDYYSPKQKMPEKKSPENHIGGGFYHQMGTPAPEQPVYMVQSQAGFYQTRPTGQGYYAFHKTAPEINRDQPMQFNMVQSAPPKTTVHALPQPPSNVAGISDGFGTGRVDYMRVAYDSEGGMGPPLPYQQVMVNSNMRSNGGITNQEINKSVP